MENNDTISSATSVASKGPDKAVENDQPQTVSDKPNDTTLLQKSYAVSHEDSVAVKEGSTQAKDYVEAQEGSRDSTSAETKPAGLTSTSGTQSYVPPVKRFSAVNINKKFLQKNQTSTAASGGALSASSSGKQPGTLARPAPQTAHSHSRLVTAKLTASPLSSSSGQGWSRPSSVTPPAPSPGNAPGPTKGPAPAIAPVGGHGLPLVAPGGKIIQPQVLRQKSDGPGRPAWRSVHPGTTASGLQAQKEFPTAAEAAQSRLAKPLDGKAASEVPDIHKQAMSESADAFRGVHLDPNAHHWDEMEEGDNDDYLGDVIEFGDGRQYTIHVSEEQAEIKAPEDNAGSVASEAPISKEDRFVDDFDRSWPKSSAEYGKDEMPQQRRPSRSDTASNFSGHSPVSVRDSMQSRLLFNERSNRMEPISGGRPGPGSFGPGRGVQIQRDRPDGPGRFHSGRLERDAPPHSAFRRPHDSPWNHPHSTEQHTRDLRELKAEPTSYFHGDFNDRKGRSEWPAARARGGPSPNGRVFGSREPSSSRSINGAPSIASSDGHSSRYAPSMRDQHKGFPSGPPRDMEKQLSPHFTQPQSVAPSEKSLADADAHTASGVDAIRDRDQPESALGLTAHPQAEVDESKAQPSAPSNDPEAIRKAFLHDRAEAAKIRRQHEEEERMKAQERARKKAAELEARITAAKAAKNESHPTEKPEPVAAAPLPEAGKQKPTEAEVLRVIEGAISSAVSSEVPIDGRPNEPQRKESDGQTSSFAKALFRGESSRSVDARETQEPGQPKRSPPTTKADQAESWRAKSKPPILPVENSKNDISREPAVSVLPDVRAFDIQADESTEVVEFNDMSRLVVDKSQKPPSESDSTSVRPSRPVASDFFKGSFSHSQKPEQDTWRRADTMTRRAYSRENGLGDASQQRTPGSIPEDWSDSQLNGEAQPKSPISQPNGVLPPTTPNQHSHSASGAPRFLRSPHGPYREAPLAALDDTMSRIKGALDVMHSANEHGPRETSGPSTVRLPAPTSVPPMPTKWLPPALRPSGVVSNNKRTDTFEPTHPEPPRSPAPPVNKVAIRLPSVSRRIEPLTKRQINYQKYFGPVRWEILSFDPPVEGMTKKSLSVNDVLFKKPQGPFKMRRYRVQLPKSNTASQRSPRIGFQGVDRNTISRTASQGTTDDTIGVLKSGQSSWRSSTSTRLGENGAPEKRIASTLDITSRSPPPELATRTERAPTISGVAIKHRTSQRSLDVTDVAFYRDVRRPADSNVPVVTFTVSSELESQGEGSASRKTPVLSDESTKPLSSNVLEPSTSDVKPSSLPQQSSMTSSLLSGEDLPPSPLLKSAQSDTQAGGSAHSKVFEPQGGPFLQRQPVTPPPQNASSSWAKSPARAPDPEHLKAVWSQAPDGDLVPAVNSLKNIADDLPAVPFTLQEVKSEGGTPPPAPPGPVAPPTRMSASEVTRAFQTVPAGPSNGVGPSGLRSNQIPSNLGSPIGAQRALKPPTIGLPPPPSVNAGAPRPPFMGYPTSAPNHSPSPPTLVYSHVMPNGMGGSPVGSPYGQPVWMPVVQQGQQMLRPQSSAPYSPSLMPYSVPSVQNGMYPPSNMGNAQGSPATYSSAPLPSGMMVSPVLTHATAAPPTAMYPGSPMVMHVAPPGATSQSRPPYPPPPGPVGMGRASLPVTNPMDPRSQPAVPGPLPQPHYPHPPAAPASRFSTHNPGYSPAAPPQSYVRPW